MTVEPRRVVSLAPSATGAVRAVDAADALVGVTHHCDPGGAADAGAGPAVVGGWPDPDRDRVVELDPDAVLTCDPLQRETAEALRERGLPVTHVEPATLDGAFDSLRTLADAVGRPAAGERLAADCRRRVDRVRAAVPDDPAERPVVYCEEWSDPPMAAGNWVPDAVRAAGGRYPFVGSGERSRPVEDGEVPAADPDHVVLHVCGRGERSDPAALDGRGWDLDAAVHTVDDDLLNRPGPPLVEGIETLASLFHGVDAGGAARVESD
ncbi:helical backbone metal receptor [Candidatus Halobonum tyrrellensis]|uniref:Iron/cobalamin ABC transporter periplasmic substrate-binding protein n=1 Tax=Candidatus Halobonum tyrrellensis G22 TaxID=1324957 RepID=V4HK96_9EURY|nr:helical backbone metal receptor [Candidatus Halobonum tyrrellensis]ESP88314.1 iron/cobalamin ABC transporter periplasmic substrate-binding protein [Candidatus Halobonum tyrrellensis G22]